MWYEATKSGGRIPENEGITQAIIRIAKELQVLRSKYGSITVTSWYRPPTVNRNVGGTSRSQHLNGHAVDIIVGNYDPEDFTKLVSDFWVGGVGDSPAFTHLDLGTNRRWNYG
jgi:uncharacterized protein YcbK (DUF882 family)